MRPLPESRGLFTPVGDHRKRAAAFSVPDLLSMVGILSLLFLIQITGFAHNKGNSHRARCADNLRRLGLSWQMYADDNRSRLVPSPFLDTNNWVAGWLDYSGNPKNTNLDLITQAKLFPYNNSTDIYRCPDDLSTYLGQGRIPRIRSYSMNSWLGEGATGWLPTGVFQIMTNRFQVRQPDQTFVFIDEHPDSINDGQLIVDMLHGGATAMIIDYPASYHNLGANLGYADGGVRNHQWLDPRTTPLPSYINEQQLNVAFPNDPDVAWLQSVTTYRK